MIKKENPDRKQNLKSSLFTFLKRFCKPNRLWRISPFYNNSPLWNFQVLHVGLSGNLVKWNTFYLMHCSQRDLFISILKKVFPIKTLLNTKNNRWLGKGHTQIHTLEKLENVWYNVIVYIGISPRPFKSLPFSKIWWEVQTPAERARVSHYDCVHYLLRPCIYLSWKFDII